LPIDIVGGVPQGHGMACPIIMACPYWQIVTPSFKAEFKKAREDGL